MAMASSRNTMKLADNATASVRWDPQAQLERERSDYRFCRRCTEVTSQARVHVATTLPIDVLGTVKVFEWRCEQCPRKS
jgi:hypothetical protein